MTKEPEDWSDTLTPEIADELDVDLIDELNQNDPGIADDENKTPEYHSPIIFKAIGLLVTVAFIAAIWSNWLWIMSMLPLDFLTKSGELSKDPSIQNLQRAVVMIKVSDRRGSGFNISPDGLIITNEHVIRGSKNLDVSFQDGSFYSGSVVTSYPDVDLAVVKIDGRNLPWLELKMDAKPAAGDEVTIIGNPLGFTDVVMTGFITGDIKLRGWDVPVMMVKGPIKPGSSGSPVLNSNGQVIAVIFGTINSTDTDKKGETMGLAVPTKYLDGFLNDQ